MGPAQTLRLRRDRLAGAVLTVLGLVACGQSPAPDQHDPESSPGPAESAPGGAEPPDAPDVAQPESGRDGSSATEDLFGTLTEALGRGSGGSPIPDGLVSGGDCPEVGADADQEITAQASARVPLKVGLTLTNLWNPNPEEEYECLTQVTAVQRDSIDATLNCNSPRTRRAFKRRLCRVDLDAAHMLMTETGLLTVIDASGEEIPETIVGATWFSLSQRQFAELKRTGSVRHQYVQLNGSGNRVDVETTSVLRREGAETARVVVNDRVAEIPVIRASGEASSLRQGRIEKEHVTALIMDDERFPFLVDYMHSTEPGGQPYFRLNYATISFPDAVGDDAGGAGYGAGGGEMERRLAEEKRVDVYGIYFDFNSDRIRQESEPILREIAELLGRNPDWTLGINGHTDNVGGDAYNLELSRRRSEAVRKALMDRLGIIAADRLTTAGYGASAPKDTNETREGRARNRRVELVRH